MTPRRVEWAAGKGFASLVSVRLAVLALLALACALPTSAAGTPYTAQGNKVLCGSQGGYTAGHIADFERQSGKHPAVFNYFIDWGAQDGWLGARLQNGQRLGSHPMLSLSTSGTGLTPRDLATGDGDNFLLRLNASSPATATWSSCVRSRR
jgi:hypothetical protein